MDWTTFLNTIDARFRQVRYVFGKVTQWFLSLMNVFSGISCVGVAILLILDFGFHLSSSNVVLFAEFQFYFLAYFFIDLAFRLVFQKGRLTYFLFHPTDIFILYPVIYFFPELSHHYSYFFNQIALLIVMLGRLPHLRHLIAWLSIKPAQVFVLGFLVAIFLGSLLLSLPISTVSTEGIAFIDALFTAFSAVCVTGLVVNDVGSTFTMFGQFVILVLIQIGGLGIMSFSVLLALVLHRRLSQTASRELQENYSTVSLSETFQAISFIFKLTLIVEFLGASVLFFFIYGDFDHWSKDLFVAVFHSVSAFCNAGFSLFPDSLMMYSAQWPIIGTVSILIIVGGLGFPVLFNLAQRRVKTFAPLKVQTKLAIKVTLYLLVFGTVIIYLLEGRRALAGLGFGEQMLVCFFQSVSARTAGFNSFDLTLFHPGTILMMMMLMVVGASPGSTGGGIKTTTFGVIVLSLIQTFKGAKRIQYSSRKISMESVIKAYVAFFMAISMIVLFFFILVLVEKGDILPLLFETVSAFGTVGFSLGVTPDLSILGKMIIMVLMFVGRIGPLTIAMALARPKPEFGYEYPEERIGVL